MVAFLTGAYLILLVIQKSIASPVLVSFDRFETFL